MGELEIEVLELAAVECRRRAGTAVEPPTRPPLARGVRSGAAAAFRLIPRVGHGGRRLAGGDKSSGAVGNWGQTRLREDRVLTRICPTNPQLYWFGDSVCGLRQKYLRAGHRCG